MEKVIAFDSKDFNRGKYKEIPAPDNPELKIKKFIGYYTPLGCGVLTQHPELLEQQMLVQFAKLKNSFGFDCDLPFLDSHEIKSFLDDDMAKTIAFCDQLLKNVEDFIDFVFFSYIVLPPPKIPKITVGGIKCPKIEIETHTFLRNASPAFSSLTAWAYTGLYSVENTHVYIDSFRYKQMSAWNQLIERCHPEIFPHGDECNPFIALADIIAFLTDSKLYIRGKKDAEFKRLTPDNLKEVWKDYSFKMDAWFLDERGLGLYAWHSNNLIDLKPFIKRPIVFFLADNIESLDTVTPPDSPDSENIPKERRFNRQLRRMPAFRAATKYAYQLHGSIQFYDRYQDAGLIQDGDVIVYMGENSKKIAETFNDAYDLKIIRAKDLKNALKDE